MIFFKDQGRNPKKVEKRALLNLLIKTSTHLITCIAIRLRDLYERLLSEKENKLWITVLFF